MIQPTPSLDQTDTSTCEKAESGHTPSSSRFRELVSVQPAEAVFKDQEKTQKPSARLSLFALVRQEVAVVENTDEEMEEEESECQSCASPLTHQVYDPCKTSDALDMTDRDLDTDSKAANAPEDNREVSEKRKAADVRKPSRTAIVPDAPVKISAQPAANHSNLPSMPVPSSPVVEVRPTAPSVSGLPATAPWQSVLECATQGISHIQREDLKETTLTLDGPLFANTPLAGVKMTVKEYSTAPLAFSIHFACAPHALNFLQPHLKTLSSLFQNRRLPFSIHSIDADLGDGVPSPIQKDKGDDEEEPRG